MTSSKKKNSISLFSAIRANSVNWVRRLLEIGADPSRRNNKGLTPFQVAATQEKANEILDLLLASDKVDINERGKFGLSVFHFALATSNETAARFLLSKGADPYVADENGVTPLHLAANFPNSLDNSGQNVLHGAKQDIRGQSEDISDPLKGALEVIGNKKFKLKRLRVLS
jgi:ankyrin repeat protein